MDYADQLISETRNNINHSAKHTKRMPCPNRWKLGKKHEWKSLARYEAKANRKIQECPSGENGKVDMLIYESGIWTTIECPICGYIGDGDMWL